MKHTAAPKNRSPRGRIAVPVFAVAAAALLAVLTLLLCIIGGVFDFSAKAGVTMPELRGQTEANARQTLESLSLSLKVRVTTVAGEEDTGVVLEQSVPFGEVLKKNQTVRLTVSDGSLARPVPVHGEPEPETESLRAPDVVGQALEDARQSAERMGIYLTDGGSVYSNQPAGTILGQDPAAGTPLMRGSAVRVTVSLGPETPEYVISARCSAGGSVSPSGEQRFKAGERAEYTITPEEGFELRILEIDGEEVAIEAHYVFSDIQENHTLYAVFEEKRDEPGLPDVPDNPSYPSPSPDRPVDPASPSDLR